MTEPKIRPVYLVVPSSRPHGEAEVIDRVIADFVDHLAVHPATAESVLLGVAEYASFLNELHPLGDGLEDAARVRVSGFGGLRYGALFDGLAQMLEYDRWGLTERGERAGRPIVVIVVDSVPQTADNWRDGHRSLVDVDAGSKHGAPVIVAVSTGAVGADFAESIAFPSHLRVQATDAAHVGQLAAAGVIRACGVRGIGVNDESAEGLPMKGRVQ